MFVIEVVLGETSETLKNSVVKHQQQSKDWAHWFWFLLESTYV